MLTPNIEKICVICKKPFKSAKKFKYTHSHLSKNVRQKNAITCSKLCSRKYNNLNVYKMKTKK